MTRGGRPAPLIAASILVALGVAAPAPAGHRTVPAAVVAASEDAGGFNIPVSCCNSSWSSWMGAEEALRGAFLQQPNGRWVKELVSAASADATSVTYTIRPNARWYWGGRSVPVTFRDFVYTLDQLDDPNNPVVDRSGYANLDPARFSHIGLRRVTFFWRTTGCGDETPCGAYGDWQKLFSTLYPSFALRGLSFTTMWTDCICGFDGKPVADGPYYLAAYTKGVGSILRANPFWAGSKPSIPEIDFRVIADPAAEVQALQMHQVDVIAPPLGPYLLAVKNAKGTTFTEIAGDAVEHVLFREGRGSSNVLLRAPFVRQAIGLALDRDALVAAVYGDLAERTVPLNSDLFYAGETGYRADFARWGYNPRAALALMARHCTGGPAAPDPATTRVWVCSGLPATFTWTWPSGDTERAVIEAIAQAELRSVGIQVISRPLPASVFYGVGGIASGAYDIAEVPDATGGDPGEWSGLYGCRSPANLTGFCSRRVDMAFEAASRQTDPRARMRILGEADALLSKAVPVFPLYQPLDALVHVSRLAGLVDSAGPGGPFWNVERWRWTRS